MDCLNCNARLVENKDLFFYVKAERDVVLSVKHERWEFVTSKNIFKCEDKEKFVDIQCFNCFCSVGKIIPFGQRGTNMAAFGCSKVILNERDFSKREKWWELYREFENIDQRDPLTFFNILTPNNIHDREERPEFESLIKYPGYQNREEGLPDFNWYSLPLKKTPRDYQIRGMVEALQYNLIVVMQTGSGKTLVASMFLAKMCALNPKKMGVMIVDRVPLVFQQGDAVREDTDLRVVSVCGENKTSKKIKALNNGTYDVLVITAGAFYDLIVVKKTLDVKQFCAVVLDECHHVAGSHPYVKVLEIFTNPSLEYKPRLLGLTASPISGASSEEQAENRVNDFVSRFPKDTRLFAPCLEKKNLAAEEVPIKMTEEQNDFINKCFLQFKQFIEEIEKITEKRDEITVLKENLINAYQVVGDLKHLCKGHVGNADELEPLVRNALALLEVMEMAVVMGVPMACSLLSQKNEKLKDITKDFQNIVEASPRLTHLYKTLGTMAPESKVLIFVSTRLFAKELSGHLSTKYKDLKVGEKVGKKVRQLVGHGKYDGMDWQVEQTNVLESFRKGECNVLVCTSVLEEGIDVPSCDLVVYFTGVKSLIKYIQARGRARKVEDGRFIVYQSEAEGAMKRDLKQQEKLLQLVLESKQHSMVTTDCIIEEIEKVMNKPVGTDDTKSENMSNLLENNEKRQVTVKDVVLQRRLHRETYNKDFSFSIYVEPIPNVSAQDVKNKLKEALEEVQEFKLNRLQIFEYSDDSKNQFEDERRVFGKDATVFLVSVNTYNGDAIERYSMFCQVFPFELEVRGIRAHIWTKLRRDGTHIHYPNSDSKLVINGFQLGEFTSRKSYAIGYTVEYEIQVLFGGKDLVLRYESEERTEQIVIPKCLIGDFVLLSITRKSYQVAFYLKNCPFLEEVKTTKCGEEHYTRLTVDGGENNGGDIAKAFGKYSMMLFEFGKEDKDLVMEMLNDMPIPFYNVQLSSREMEQCVDFPDDADIRWSLKCLQDSRQSIFSYKTPSRLKKLIAENPEDKLAISQITKKWSMQNTLTYFDSFEDAFSEDYSTRKKAIKEDLYNDMIKEDKPKNFHVRRVVVTPLRMQVLPAVPVASNRILRKLNKMDYPFLVVSFKDEDMAKIHDTDILTRFEKCMIEGITVDGLLYKFLLATSSQIRDHKSYFINASDETIQNIREQIIPDTDSFKSAAKYISRLGIYGTADVDIGEISEDEINYIDDVFTVPRKKEEEGRRNSLPTTEVENDKNGEPDEEKVERRENLTDGAGKIAYKKAEEIAEQLSLDFVPSAFQIRYSGTKGILVTTRNDDPDLAGKSLAIRNKSMVKFKNNDRRFCVTNYSVYNEYCLNREIVTLLDAIDYSWEMRNTLIQYQENALKTYSEIFNDRHKALEELRLHISTPDYTDLKSSTIEILDEPYWISILQGIYRLRTKEVRTKTTFPINQSCLIIGVPDPYGVLKEGEIFVQIEPKGVKPEIIEGDVLVFRNPCLHPGDARTVTAVNYKELKDLVNVVVFPVKNCTKSFAVSCSGGDLDGDQYTVIWDKNLVPPKEYNFEPCDYEGLADNATKSQDKIDDVRDKKILAKFFINFMSNDCLGRIAHKHLALCDILEKGARDPLAVALAECQSQAVDFPKTGQQPLVPKAAIEKVVQFPDFMGKDLAESYVSKNILGKLYRRCISIAYDFESGSEGKISKQCNLNLRVDGSNEYMETAFETYRAYAYDMEMIMRKFELKTEADIILGRATIDWSEHFEADKGKAEKCIKQSYEAIKEKYRTIFFSNLQTEAEKLKKASAWYRVVTEFSDQVIAPNDNVEVFESFPWIVTDFLCNIRKLSNKMTISQKTTDIGRSAYDLFKENSKQLPENLREKESIVLRLRQCIEMYTQQFGIENAFVVEAYGSTSIYVSDNDSDIDICILAKSIVEGSSLLPPEASEELDDVSKQRYLLKQHLTFVVEKISDSKRELFTANVPIIKCNVNINGTSNNCDISMNEIGYRKTLYIHHLYKLQRYYAPLFSTLVKWARISGICKSEGNHDKEIDTAVFYALIIHVLDLPRMESMDINDESLKCKFEDVYKQELDDNDFHKLGELIFRFFRTLSMMKGNMTITWPAPGIDQIVEIDESNMIVIAGYAGKAFHAISVTRDMNAMFDYFLKTSKKQLEITKVFSLTLTDAIENAVKFHEQRLSDVSGADVKISKQSGKPNLVLHGEGSFKSIEKLKQELRTMMYTNKALLLGKLPQKGSRYFMEGSSIIMVKGNHDINTPLHFEDSQGAYELHHYGNKLSVAHVSNWGKSSGWENESTISKNEEIQWKDRELERLKFHFFKQLQAFPTDDKTEDLLKTLEVTSRFGCFYLIDIQNSLPPSRENMGIEEMQLAVEKGRRARKSWERNEFIGRSDALDNKRVALRESKGSREHERLPKGSIERSTRSGIAAAFTPGLLKNNCNDQSVIKYLVESYRNALEGCGFFKKGQTTKRELPPPWKASINANSNFELQLNMEDVKVEGEGNKRVMKVRKLTERSLNWVHGTLLDGRSQNFNEHLRTNSDLRFLLSTQDPVAENTDLYNAVIIKGSPPVGFDNNGNPVNKESNNKVGGGKSFVSLLRNVESVEVYTNGSVDASIVKGKVYFGEDMNLTRPICEMSLYFDSAPIKKSIREDLDQDILNDYVQNMFDTTLKIKEKLDEILEVGNKNRDQQEKWNTH